MKKRATAMGLLAVVAVAAGFFITAAKPLPPSALPAYAPDAANGKLLYTAAGCFSCHKPKKGTAKAKLPSGGRAFKTPLGVFYPPNLTPDESTGIGAWSDIDFVNAVKRGISPDKQHYIPAFPYTSYAKLTSRDVLDIKAYLMTLEPVVNETQPTDLPFAWVLRRGVGLWKYLGFDTAGFTNRSDKDTVWNRGAYLVDAAAHCGECHTPRNIFMVPRQSAYLSGGAHPEGEGKVPSLRDLIKRKRFKDLEDLKTALQWGETFGYEDMSSGGMGDVQENLSELPEAEIEAIARYLTDLDALAN